MGEYSRTQSLLIALSFCFKITAESYRLEVDRTQCHVITTVFPSPSKSSRPDVSSSTYEFSTSFARSISGRLTHTPRWDLHLSRIDILPHLRRGYCESSPIPFHSSPLIVDNLARQVDEPVHKRCRVGRGRSDHRQSSGISRDGPYERDSGLQYVAPSTTDYTSTDVTDCANQTTSRMSTSTRAPSSSSHPILTDSPTKVQAGS